MTETTATIETKVTLCCRNSKNR